MAHFQDASMYGIMADGVTDDTAALQAFVDDITDRGLKGVLPAGTILISDTIDIPKSPGWALIGAGPETTTIEQATDNTPIFDFGPDAGSQIHSIEVSGIGFTYSNVQSSANTSANTFVFSSEVYWAVFDRLTFRRGSYAMRVGSGVGCPWGSTFDNITFGSELSIGAMDWSDGINAVPNNRFGRIFVDGTSAIGPIFDIRGYAFVIDTIEFAACHQSPTLIKLGTGSTKVSIGALKLENGTYDSNANLFDFTGNVFVDIGHLVVSGDSMEVDATVYLVAVNSGAGTGGFCRIGKVDVSLSALTSGAAYVCLVGTAGEGIQIDSIEMDGNWTLHNGSSTTTPERVQVTEYVRGRVSSDKGDANYTQALGDPNVVMFNTTLTAPRTVNLLHTGRDRLIPNGVWYRIVSAGAVNGANTITVKQNTTTLATLTADNTSVLVMYRRGAAAHEWVVVPT